MKDLFLTRQIQYRVLEKRVNSFLEGYRQNIAILGPNLSGKTYLMEQILKTISLKTDALPLYIDLEYVNFSEFFKVIFTSLLFYYLKKKKEHAIYDLDMLILETQDTIPKTVEKIKDSLNLLYTKEKVNFELITSTITEFINETNIKILFILDNFTAFKYFSKKIVSEFAKFIITQKDIMFIFLSKEIKKAEELLSQELNLLFGNFEKIYMENLSYKEAVSYLEVRLPEKLSVSLRKFLIELTEGFPFYLDAIIHDLQNLQDKVIDFELLRDVLTNLLISPESSLYQAFNNKISLIKSSYKDNFLINPLLISIASGYTRKKDLASILKVDYKNLAHRLSKLLETQIINKSGSFYYIPDKLFSFWTLSVFKNSVNAPLIFYEDKKEFIKNKLNEKFDEFNQATIKEDLQRFVELVYLFKDDTVKIGKKSISLPQIKRLKIVSAHNKDMKFIIGEAKQYYLILAFKEKMPQDTDILEFSNRCSYFRHKQPKKIFITLDKADVTTKVLAKEKRLFFWEGDDVNHLLRLYNKPLII